MRSSKLLEFIYQHTDNQEWVDGIELHQSERVLKTTQHGELLITSVSCFSGRDYEVRIKLHENRRIIQWLECTCHKNRKNALFCENSFLRLPRLHILSKML